MTDWKARAEREAAAILAGLDYPPEYNTPYQRLIDLMAVAFLQGMNLGCHTTLAEVERALTAEHR